MTFKQNWGKTNELHSLSDDTIKGMVKLSYPDKPLFKGFQNHDRN